MKFYKTAKITAKCGIVDQLDEVNAINVSSCTTEIETGTYSDKCY